MGLLLMPHQRCVREQNRRFCDQQWASCSCRTKGACVSKTEGFAIDDRRPDGVTRPGHMRLLDSHCHLERKDFTAADGSDEREAVIARALAAGVEALVC